MVVLCVIVVVINPLSPDIYPHLVWALAGLNITIV